MDDFREYLEALEIEAQRGVEGAKLLSYSSESEMPGRELSYLG